MSVIIVTTSPTMQARQELLTWLKERVSRYTPHKTVTAHGQKAAFTFHHFQEQDMLDDSFIPLYELVRLMIEAKEKGLINEVDFPGLYPCCEVCARPIERAYEGRLIDPDCADWEQMSHKEREMAKEVRWIRTHCAICEKPISSQQYENYDGLCTECIKEQQELLAGGRL